MPSLKSSTSPSSDQKLWAVAGYLWILSLAVLAAKKDDAYVRFHASQGALLFVLWLIFLIIPVLGWFLHIVLFVVAIIGMVKAFQGERWELPVFGSYATKLGDWLIKTLKV